MVDITNIDITNLKNFIVTPFKKDKIIQITIVRDKSDFSKKLYPLYHVYFS